MREPSSQIFKSKFTKLTNVRLLVTLLTKVPSSEKKLLIPKRVGKSLTMAPKNLALYDSKIFKVDILPQSLVKNSTRPYWWCMHYQDILTIKTPNVPKKYAQIALSSVVIVINKKRSKKNYSSKDL